MFNYSKTRREENVLHFSSQMIRYFLSLYTNPSIGLEKDLEWLHRKLLQSQKTNAHFVHCVLSFQNIFVVYF